MNLLSMILIGLSLSLDAAAVAAACGATGLRLRLALRIAAFFGGFQCLMPVIGWLSGSGLTSVIAGFDHWLAFGLLVIVGGRMIYESFRSEKNKPIDSSHLPVLLLLSLATSIDALAVGISLAFLKVSIFKPAVIIGLITFCLSLAGVYFGKIIGRIIRHKLELLGGVILLGIGVRILIEHLH